MNTSPEHAITQQPSLADTITHIINTTSKPKPIVDLYTANPLNVQPLVLQGEKEIHRPNGEIVFTGSAEVRKKLVEEQFEITFVSQANQRHRIFISQFKDRGGLERRVWFEQFDHGVRKTYEAGPTWSGPIFNSPHFQRFLELDEQLAFIEAIAKEDIDAETILAFIELNQTEQELLSESSNKLASAREEFNRAIQEMEANRSRAWAESRDIIIG